MKIRVTSTEYDFESADAFLVMWDADPTGGLYRLTDGVIPAGEHDVRPGSLRILLSSLLIRRRADGLSISIPSFSFEGEITQEAIDGGEVAFDLAPDGVFNIEFTRSGEPNRLADVTFHQDMFSMTVKTDANGGVVWLGNPFEFYLPLPEGTGVTIRPVPSTQDA